jgi:inner membrane protein
MDPLTQGIVGSTVSQSFSKKQDLIIAGIIGFLAGLAPDIDIFIRSNIDPLLFLEYHRQFTHSLLFIPMGSLICALVFYYTFSKRFNFSFINTYIFSFLGYATHGIIDAFTTYGTQLYWPFSSERLAFNTISVIDPLFTLPVIILSVITIINKNKQFLYIAIIWMFAYQSIAHFQKNKAESIINDYASSKGHIINSIEAKPSFANILVWKVIYSDNTHYYINAVRMTTFHTIFKGESIKKINVERDFPWLNPDSQQAKDLQRFKWFSNDYLAIDKLDNSIIYDIRFSAIPNETEGLWGIKLDKNKENDEHVKYITNREQSFDKYSVLLKMIFYNEH